MPVITIGRQFGAGGTTVGGILARELGAALLESRIIDEVAHRLQLPKEEVEAEDEQPGSLLARLLVALGSASTEPMLPPAPPPPAPPARSRCSRPSNPPGARPTPTPPSTLAKRSFTSRST